MPGSTRRQLLGATALLTLSGSACARTVSGSLPWSPNDAYPNGPIEPGGYMFFSPAEAAAIDAILARLIPTDDLGPGAKDAGCTLFIDRQLAGPYGAADWLYMQPPFSANPLPSQGLQSPLTPRQQYRQGLAALSAYTKANFSGREFAELEPADQDKLLASMEKGEAKFTGFDSKMLFLAVYANTIEGYFADPIYGGNKDMAGWKLVGFPGARYDYRDVLQHPNQPYTTPPVALSGRPAWGQPT